MPLFVVAYRPFFYESGIPKVCPHAPRIRLRKLAPHALKGQKLLAQGNALGIQQAAIRPVRAKALQHQSTLIQEYEFFIIFHMI